jgi:hypothetical protein
LNDFIQVSFEKSTFQEKKMSNAPLNTATPNAQNANAQTPGAQKILAKDIHAKWNKISDVEASGMRQTSDLVSQVQAKYALSSEQAQKDVNVWANGRSF